MLRGTCYRDMSEDDPDFPEQFRTDLPPSGDTLQRKSNSYSMDGDNLDEPTQVQQMSEDGPSDWAEEMQRDSAERLANKTTTGLFQKGV